MQVIAQALWAACSTVESTHGVHSLHAYFIRPGDVEPALVLHLLPDPAPVLVETTDRRGFAAPARYRGPDGWHELVAASGPDAQDAVAAIAELIESGMGERAGEVAAHPVVEAAPVAAVVQMPRVGVPVVEKAFIHGNHLAVNAVTRPTAPPGSAAGRPGMVRGC